MPKRICVWRDRECLLCGEVFTPTGARQRYCIEEHARTNPQRKAHNKQRRAYLLTCKGCGDEFRSLTQRRYCDRACYRKHNPLKALTPRPARWCEWCGGSFMGTGAQRFCSRTHQRYGTERKRASRIWYGDCEECGRLFVGRGRHRGCCSPRCSARVIRRKRKRKDRARRRAIRHTPYTLRQIAERDGWRCHLCGKRVPDRVYRARPLDPTIDHLVPLSAQGDDTPENVALAHNRCNWQRAHTGPAQLRLIA